MSGLKPGPISEARTQAKLSEGKGKMEAQERRLVLEQLASSEARLLELVEGLTVEQWGFREAAGRWSIAEVIEHCIVFEEFIRGRIAEALTADAEPEKKAGAAAKESLVMG